MGVQLTSLKKVLAGPTLKGGGSNRLDCYLYKEPDTAPVFMN